MNGFLAAFRNEVFVGLRSLGTRFVILTPVLLVAVQLVLAKLTESTAAARDNLLGSDRFNDLVAEPAYGNLVDGLNTGLILLGLLLVAQSAFSFSADRDSGALRHLIIRRCSRSAVVLAKFAYLLLMAVVALSLLLLASYFLSGMLWEYGPVVEDGFELISEAEIRTELLLGLRLAILPLPAAIGLGLCFSIAANSATQAVIAALGVTLALDMFKGMMGDSADYIYARFMPSLLNESYLSDVGRLVRGYSDVLIDERFIQFNYWVPLPSLLLLLVAGLVLVRRKKI